MADQPPQLPAKVAAQIARMRLPQSGAVPFRPRLVRNKAGEPVMARAEVRTGPRRGTPGLVDEAGRIWIRDSAHAGVPEHWDVQVDGGAEYVRVGYDGIVIP